MIRHIEYRDAEGKLWAAAHNTPGGTRKQSNEHLAHTAAVYGWKDLVVYPEDAPAWKIRERINAIQKENGEPPIWDEEQTKPPTEKPKASIIVGTDLHTNQPIVSPLHPAMATGPARTTPAFGRGDASLINDLADRVEHKATAGQVDYPPTIANNFAQPAPIPQPAAPQPATIPPVIQHPAK